MLRNAPSSPSLSSALPSVPQVSFEEPLAQALFRLDAAALASSYQEDGGLVVLPDVVSAAQIAAMQAEARALQPLSRRTFAPFVRKAEAICHHDIVANAPALHGLHQSPSLLALCQRIAGPDLSHRQADDPHASGLYIYNRARDYVGWHFDDCGCEPEASFTVIAGIIDDSSSRLEVELHRKTPGRQPIKRTITTRPGTLVVFRGSSVYHRVTALPKNQERVSFSFVYVKKGFHPRGFDRVWQSTIDTLLYFGWRGVPRRKMPPR